MVYNKFKRILYYVNIIFYIIILFYPKELYNKHNIFKGWEYYKMNGLLATTHKWLSFNFNTLVTYLFIYVVQTSPGFVRQVRVPGNLEINRSYIRGLEWTWSRLCKRIKMGVRKKANEKKQRKKDKWKNHLCILFFAKICWALCRHFWTFWFKRMYCFSSALRDSSKLSHWILSKIA